jgi:hypothetical protein
MLWTLKRDGRLTGMKALNWIIALCGLWELGDIVLPFIIGFGNVQAFVWNHIIVGMVLVLAGVWAARTSNVGTARTLDWIAAVAGLWLMIAPFLLGPPDIAAGLWNDLIVGVIVLILGIWAALALPRRAG